MRNVIDQRSRRHLDNGRKASGSVWQRVCAALVLGLLAIELTACDGGSAATVERAFGCPLDEIGGASFRADIAGMRHETQYTRLFRS